MYATFTSDRLSVEQRPPLSLLATTGCAVLLALGVLVALLGWKLALDSPAMAASLRLHPSPQRALARFFARSGLLGPAGQWAGVALLFFAQAAFWQALRWISHRRRAWERHIVRLCLLGSALTGFAGGVLFLTGRM